MYIVKLKKV